MQFSMNIPLSHRAVVARSQKDVRFGWVELSTAYRCDMTLCVTQVLKVHVTAYSCLQFLAVIVIDPCLVVGAADEEQTGLCVGAEAELRYWVAIEWPELFERPQRAGHRCRVPNLKCVVTGASRQHLCA